MEGIGKGGGGVKNEKKKRRRRRRGNELGKGDKGDGEKKGKLDK